MNDSLNKMDPLEICVFIRDKLRESGAENLPLCPIEELLPTGPQNKQNGYMIENHFLGFCHSEHSDWEGEFQFETSKTTKTTLIEIALRKRTTLEALPLLVIIPTFIHELAHSITPAKRQLVNGKYRSLGSHGKDFYDNFAHLLRIAEAENIFSLPPTKTKFSMKNLKRYDALDIVNAPLGFVGSSKLFDSIVCNNNNTVRELRITLIDSNNKKKPVTVMSDFSIDRLLQIARQKFQVKYTCVKDVDGAICDTLKSVPSGCSLFLTKNK